MAQFDFYGNWEDSWQVVESILLNKNIKVLPDMWYDKPVPKYFTKLNEELKQLLLKKRRLYLSHYEVSIYRPIFEICEKGIMIGKYSVSSNWGGPFLDLTLPGVFDIEGVIQLGPGTLTYPKLVQNPQTMGWEDTGPAIREAYKEICDVIKKVMIRQKRNSKNFLIGADGLNVMKTKDVYIVGVDKRT
jgi:hypothetical protein